MIDDDEDTNDQALAQVGPMMVRATNDGVVK